MSGCGCQKPYLGRLGLMDPSDRASSFYKKTPEVVKSWWGEAPTWAQVTIVVIGGLLVVRVLKAFNSIDYGPMLKCPKSGAYKYDLGMGGLGLNFPALFSTTATASDFDRKYLALKSAWFSQFQQALSSFKQELSKDATGSTLPRSVSFNVGGRIVNSTVTLLSNGVVMLEPSPGTIEGDKILREVANELTGSNTPVRTDEDIERARSAQEEWSKYNREGVGIPRSQSEWVSRGSRMLSEQLPDWWPDIEKWVKIAGLMGGGLLALFALNVILPRN